MEFSLLLCQVANEVTVEPGVFSELAPPIQVALFLGALSFATAALISLTAFTRIIIVLSFVRRALSTQEIPPNQVMLGLALFLTIYVMSPTFDRVYQQGVVPYLNVPKGEEAEKAKQLNNLIVVATEEIKLFMVSHTRQDELALFVDLSGSGSPTAPTTAGAPGSTQPDSYDLKILVPAFVISELKTAFIMGFCIYIPFLLIDLVISTVLMSLGMMMMPPVIVSTPCKLLLFVLVDGWQLICRALVDSFGI